MEKITLYNYFRSSASFRVRIALHHKGLPFEYKSVHLLNDGGQQNKPEYLQLNPFAEVPFLLHGKNGLGQSLAIIQYLEREFPEHPLFPKDSFSYAKVLQICEGINASIQPLQNLKVLKELENQFGADQNAKNRWAIFWIERGLGALEKVFATTAGNYCFGNSVTAADACLVPQITTGLRFSLDYKKFSKCAEIYERFLQLETFKKAHPDNQPDTPKS